MNSMAPSLVSQSALLRTIARPGALEIEESRQLVADRRRVGGDRVRGRQRPLAGPAARVADEPRAAAHQHHRPMSGALQVHESHHRHQVADVQARRRRVEPGVARHGRRRRAPPPGRRCAGRRGRASAARRAGSGKACNQNRGPPGESHTPRVGASARPRLASPDRAIALPPLPKTASRVRPPRADRGGVRGVLRRRGGGGQLDAGVRRRPLPVGGRARGLHAAPDVQGVRRRRAVHFRAGPRAPHADQACRHPARGARRLPRHRGQALLLAPRHRFHPRLRRRPRATCAAPATRRDSRPSPCSSRGTCFPSGSRARSR